MIDTIWTARIPSFGNVSPDRGFLRNSLAFCEGMLVRDFVKGLPRAAAVATKDRVTHRTRRVRSWLRARRAARTPVELQNLPAEWVLVQCEHCQQCVPFRYLAAHRDEAEDVCVPIGELMPARFGRIRRTSP